MILELMAARSAGVADQTASTYSGAGFLVDLTGLDEVEGMPSRSGVHLSNISLVIRGPFVR